MNALLPSLLALLGLGCLDPLPVEGEVEPELCSYFQDSDNDGYGDPGTAFRAECDDPALVDNDLDCDDHDARINPDGVEICNSRDDDCNGLVDDDPPDVEPQYADRDDDGFGDPDNVLQACELQSGYTRDSSDCDDSRDDAFPGAEEWCNEADDDCDGTVDEDALDQLYWWFDGDGDGFGDPNGTMILACEQPSRHADNDMDCFDNNSLVFPGQPDFFYTTRGDGSWDYDCSNNTEKQWAHHGSCDSDCAMVEGWSWYVIGTPSCGETSDLLSACAPSGLFCDATHTETMQGCH